MATFNNSIAIAGTHGKTTTTSMMSEIMLAANLDPTISNGGILNSINKNYRIGHSENFILEACEYTNSFFEFYPMYTVVLNIEEDHLDFFKDLEDIKNSFLHFMNNTKEGGYVIINNSIDGVKDLIHRCDVPCITFGLDNTAMYYPMNISYDALGYGSYDLYKEGTNLGKISLSVPGEHNILNSLSAAIVALLNGISMEYITTGLNKCTGSKRRFEKKGELNNGAVILDDYAHHPTEIKATLNAAKRTSFKRIVCIFQPHTYSRTKTLFNDFVEALSLADEVVLADIYAARETDTLGMSSELLCEAINKNGTKAVYFDSFEKIEKYLLNNSLNGDLLITMGAGNVVNIGENLLK